MKKNHNKKLASAPCRLDQVNPISSNHQRLVFWVIYFNPSDYPNKYVIRRHRITFEKAPKKNEILESTIEVSKECTIHDSIEEARSNIPYSLTCIGRDPGDDAAIYEVWI